MSLYLDYRPQEWDEIVGNKETVQAIENMLKKGNPPHSYLLTGGTGCGKTTVARILATKLGCTEANFREVTPRKIDEIRSIIGSSKYKPMDGSDCCVWYLDEIHLAGKDAQDTLLKILEDTPNHVYFILSTTDPQKLAGPVKGRCMTFDMKVLSDKEMLKLLAKIVKAEGEKLDRVVYEQIIDDAQGHPRNAIQVLEKVLNTDEDNRLEIAKSMAEQVNESIELCRALLKQDNWKKVSAILVGLKAQEPESVRRVVLGYCTTVLLKSSNDTAAMIIEYFEEPLYNVGFPGLVKNCYCVIKG